ncbi:MAG: efflux RND transporter periplasmic adaptor subunit [Elusimicrobiota bacterium]
MNKKIILIITISIAVLIIGFISTKKIKKQEKEVTEIIRVTYGSIKTFISTTGIVDPQNRLEIKPPITGRMDEILVEEGAKVRKGQIIGWMSSTERAALLDTAYSQDKDTVEYWKSVYKPTPIIAPINGSVIVRAIEPGQSVTQTSAIFVLSDKLIVKAYVDETDIGRVKKGQSADISLDAYPEAHVQGMVSHISYEAVTVNNVTMYEVNILPRDIPSIFRSGMSANIEIVEQDKKNILVIPQEVVIQNKNKKTVFVLNNGQTAEVKIKTGLSDEQNIEVIEGLEEGDSIVTTRKVYKLSNSEEGKSNPFMPQRRQSNRNKKSS